MLQSYFLTTVEISIFAVIFFSPSDSKCDESGTADLSQLVSENQESDVGCTACVDVV